MRLIYARVTSIYDYARSDSPNCKSMRIKGETMIKAVLKACLTKRQQTQGLRLVEPDDRTVELRDKDGKRLAVWSSSGVTVEEIRESADIILTSY